MLKDFVILYKFPYVCKCRFVLTTCLSPFESSFLSQKPPRKTSFLYKVFIRTKKDQVVRYSCISKRVTTIHLLISTPSVTQVASPPSDFPHASLGVWYAEGCVLCWSRVNKYTYWWRKFVLFISLQDKVHTRPPPHLRATFIKKKFMVGFRTDCCLLRPSFYSWG